ncbi:MAG: PorV/PorQ family protein [Bacteroidota bacterium]
MMTRLTPRMLAGLLVAGLWMGFSPPAAQAQTVAKYGADFLAGGVGARALGMGGAYVGLTDDVHAVYWNPAGLSGLSNPELAYMHAERFAGVVSFDYAAGAFPVNEQSVVAAALFRSGVNDIVNTLDAWDPILDQPKPNPEQFFRRFSAADYAFVLSYARRVNEQLSVGVSGKIIRRTIGDFADAWGYSVDVGVRYQTSRWAVGANVQDVSTMLQSWSIDRQAFSLSDTNPETGQPYTFEEAFGQALPEGGTYLVLPVARLGGATFLPFGQSRVTASLDVDVAFDGQQTYVFNAGDVSFHPRVGAEYSYREVVALRAGISRFTHSERYGLNVTPSVGAGLRLRQISVDYSFGDFAGLTSDLGFSHRVSLQVSLRRDDDA